MYVFLLTYRWHTGPPGYIGSQQNNHWSISQRVTHFQAFITLQIILPGLSKTSLAGQDADKVQYFLAFGLCGPGTKKDTDNKAKEGHYSQDVILSRGCIQYSHSISIQAFRVKTKMRLSLFSNTRNPPIFYETSQNFPDLSQLQSHVQGWRNEMHLRVTVLVIIRCAPSPTPLQLQRLYSLTTITKLQFTKIDAHKLLVTSFPFIHM
jgi:hypothetical protein